MGADGGLREGDELERVLLERLSPAGVAMLVAVLQSAAFVKPSSEDGRRALAEVEWFSGRLTEMLGAAELGRLMEDLGL